MSRTARRGLGRGLGSLIPTAPPDPDDRVHEVGAAPTAENGEGGQSMKT